MKVKKPQLFTTQPKFLSPTPVAVAISKNYIRTLLFNLLHVVFSAVKSINFGLFLNENVAGVLSLGKWNTGIWFYHDYALRILVLSSDCETGNRKAMELLEQHQKAG